MSATTRDALLGGRVVFAQPARGYRVAIDPVLLAAAVPAVAGQRIVEFGCGVGAVLLCLAARVPGLVLHGVELMEDYAALARDNLAENGVAGVIESGRIEDFTGSGFDHVLFNPPYHPPGSDPSPDPQRRQATLERDLAAWLAAAARALRHRGRLTLIHRADRLPAVLGGLHPRFGTVEIIPLWPRAGVAAKRVIIQAILGGRGPAVLHPGLVLHTDSGYSPAAQAILIEGVGLQAKPDFTVR